MCNSNRSLFEGWLSVSALNKKEATSPLVLEKFFGAKFTYGLNIDQVSKIVNKAGPMGIVYGLINSKEAHVFNVINQNGKVSFIDGQSRGKAKLTGYMVWIYANKLINKVCSHLVKH